MGPPKDGEGQLAFAEGSELVGAFPEGMSAEDAARILAENEPPQLQPRPRGRSLSSNDAVEGGRSRALSSAPEDVRRRRLMTGTANDTELAQLYAGRMLMAAKDPMTALVMDLHIEANQKHSSWLRPAPLSGSSAVQTIDETNAPPTGLTLQGQSSQPQKIKLSGIHPEEKPTQKVFPLSVRPVCRSCRLTACCLSVCLLSLFLCTCQFVSLTDCSVSLSCLAVSATWDR